MKQVLKNREKSLGSEEFEAGAYEDDKSRILPQSKRKSLVQCPGSWFDQPSNVEPKH